MKKLAITGITGKNGKVLFEYLIANEKKVASKWSSIKFLVRDINRADFITNSDFNVAYEFVQGDLHNYETALELLEDCDTVLHISGLQQSVNIVRASVEKNIKRMILVHTTGIYSKYKSAGEGYRQIESEVNKIVDENKLDLTILRPTMIYGTLQDHNVSEFIRIVDCSKWIPVISGGHYEVQPVNCRDLGRAFYQVLMNPDKSNKREYILSGERPIELRELFGIISKELGTEKKFISCPFFIAYSGAWLLYIFSGKKKDFREKVQRMCESRAYSHQAASEDFGYSPMDIEKGVHDEVLLYLESKKSV